MLVLTRRLNETVVIGDAIRVTVAGIRGGQIRLGIAAPPDVKIVRQELCRPGAVEPEALVAASPAYRQPLDTEYPYLR